MEDFRIDPTIAYDVIELPSRGIHYANKKKSVKVAYLTASDENILSSPSLVSTNGVITELLKRKVLDKDLSVDEIVEEDRQAILIFLRNTNLDGMVQDTQNCTLDPMSLILEPILLLISIGLIKDYQDRLLIIHLKQAMTIISSMAIMILKM